MCGVIFRCCKVHGKGNSVIFINREILPGPEDVRICFTLFDDNEEFHRNWKKYSIDNDYQRKTAVYFYLFQFWELKSTKAGTGALIQQEGPEGPGSLTWGKGKRQQWSQL